MGWGQEGRGLGRAGELTQELKIAVKARGPEFGSLELRQILSSRGVVPTCDSSLERQRWGNPPKTS